MGRRPTSGPTYKHYTNCQEHGRIACPSPQEAAKGCPTCRLRAIEAQPAPAAEPTTVAALVEEARAVATGGDGETALEQVLRHNEEQAKSFHEATKEVIAKLQRTDNGQLANETQVTTFQCDEHGAVLVSSGEPFGCYICRRESNGSQLDGFRPPVLRHREHPSHSYPDFIALLLQACREADLPPPRDFEDLIELARSVINVCREWQNSDEGDGDGNPA